MDFITSIKLSNIMEYFHLPRMRQKKLLQRHCILKINISYVNQIEEAILTYWFVYFVTFYHLNDEISGVV